MSQKLKISLMVLVFVLVLGAFAAFSSYKVMKVGSGLKDGSADSSDNSGLDKNNDSGNVVLISPEVMMKYIDENIAKLSPAQAVSRSQWHVYQFWISGDQNVYADYSGNHSTRRILVEVLGDQKNPEYKVQAYFEGGTSEQDDWTLKSGNDTMFGHQLTLYLKDDKTGEWTKKN